MTPRWHLESIIPSTPTKCDLCSAYRRLAIECHPDKGNYGNSDFIELRNVFCDLSNMYKLIVATVNDKRDTPLGQIFKGQFLSIKESYDAQMSFVGEI